MPVGRFPGLVVRWGGLTSVTSVEIYIRDLELEVGRDCSGRRYGLRVNIYIPPGGRCGVGFDPATPIT